MQKTKTFRGLRFTAEAIQEAVSAVDGVWPDDSTVSRKYSAMRIVAGDEGWRYDNVDEFFADYRKPLSRAHFSRECFRRVEKESEFVSLEVDAYSNSTEVAVRAPTRSVAERIMHVFESWVSKAIQLQDDDHQPIVFIGHGRSPIWKDLRDHLRDQHGLEIEAYESGSRAGHSIRDILEEMVEASSFALLVMSAEDLTETAEYRARQNVVHEMGLFQGRLGFSRAIALVEDGVEVFSNMDGVQQIRFSKSNIRETFGDVLATIRREFGPKKSKRDSL